MTTWTLCYLTDKLGDSSWGSPSVLLPSNPQEGLSPPQLGGNLSPEAMLPI